MRNELWTLAFQAVNVLVLVWLLGRYLFRPVAGIVATRQAEATRLLDEAQSAKAQAEAAQEAARQEAARIESERNTRLKAVAGEVEAQKAAMLAAARDEAAQVREHAEAEIARARAAASALVERSARHLALDIAGRLLGRLPAAARVEGFIGGLAEAVAALPVATREELGRDGAPVRLTAAVALTPAQAQACRAALADALGHAVEIEVAVDPELVAGLELEAAHAVVRNSFRADLGRIAERLESDAHA